ncbi:MAG TPA: hypothetical protein EYO58_10225, partial [Flavobacteriales bacterium]|nr:hypothetical protein [Flavobacteriales bacterium]
LHKCPSDRKENDLKSIETKIKNALNVLDLDSEAHGIIFIPTLNECWKAFSRYVGDAKQIVSSALSAEEHEVVSCGVYTSNPPSLSGFSKNDWDRYKEKTLRRFKHGQINKLIGTSAISTGIDNSYLNYIINSTMPNSLELFYQQSGRAGRSGQESHIFTIFSDDDPKETLDWLQKNKRFIKKRRDDISTLEWFHRQSFPGVDVDSE